MLRNQEPSQCIGDTPIFLGFVPKTDARMVWGAQAVMLSKHSSGINIVKLRRIYVRHLTGRNLVNAS